MDVYIQVMFRPRPLVKAGLIMSAPLTPDEARVMSRTQLRAHIASLRPLIVPGAVFDTDVEQGCVVITAPEYVWAPDDDNFIALDSEGVRCSFSIVMVGNVR